jgi:hypothetical protein
LINAHASCGDGPGAYSHLSSMRAAGFRPCVMSFTAALKPFCAVGDLRAAKALLAEMEIDFAAEAVAQAARGGGGGNGDRGGGGGGDVFTPPGAITTAGRKKKKKKAKNSGSAGVGASPGRDWAGSGGGDFAPTVRTANTFLRGCLVAGGVSEARQLFSRLGNSGAPIRETRLAMISFRKGGAGRWLR